MVAESRQQGTDGHCRQESSAMVTVEEDLEFGKITTTCSSGHVKPTGDSTQVCSPLRHHSSAQSKHYSQTIPKVPPSCLNHVLIHPLAQHGCMFGLSSKSRKTQLLALIQAPPWTQNLPIPSLQQLPKSLSGGVICLRDFSSLGEKALVRSSAHLSITGSWRVSDSKS